MIAKYIKNYLSWIYAIGSPITFIYLVYIEADASHSFIDWVLLIVINAILAALWPVYWILYLLEFI